MMQHLLARVRRRATKEIRRGVAAVRLPALREAAENGTGSLVDPRNKVVVSLTSYGSRLRTVHLTIASIGQGTARPARIILWTDPGVDEADLPQSLIRLRRRGLEIQTSPASLGPHTKYYPYVASLREHSIPLVTADDDSIYPRGWLRRLQDAASATPDHIVCFRAHRVEVESPTRLAPYNSWPPVSGVGASVLNFATGVSGVHYPAEFLNELRRAGDAFMRSTPKADDVWLHYQAVINSRLVRQITPHSRKFPEIPATQDAALHRSNTAQSANDSQISSTYDSRAVASLWRAANGEN